MLEILIWTTLLRRGLILAGLAETNSIFIQGRR
jgi:hypothetical protein